MFTSRDKYEDGSKHVNRSEETLPRRIVIADIVGAVLSGLCVGFIVGWTRASGDEIYLRELIRVIFLAVCSYLFVTLLLSRWKGRPLRRAPNWVIIAVGGSLLFFLTVNLIPDVKYIWKFRNLA